MTFTRTRLKKSVVEAINTPQKRRGILNELNSKGGEQTLYMHLSQNKPGGWLTRIDTLKAISKVTGKNIDDLIETVVKNDKQ